MTAPSGGAYTEALRHGPSSRDQHVIPMGQDHDSDPSCWCLPITEYEDPATGGRVWLHRRTHDHSHHYRDDER